MAEKQIINFIKPFIVFYLKFLSRISTCALVWLEKGYSSGGFKSKIFRKSLILWGKELNHKNLKFVQGIWFPTFLLFAPPTRRKEKKWKEAETWGKSNNYFHSASSIICTFGMQGCTQISAVVMMRKGRKFFDMILREPCKSRNPSDSSLSLQNFCIENHCQTVKIMLYSRLWHFHEIFE